MALCEEAEEKARNAEKEAAEASEAVAAQATTPKITAPLVDKEAAADGVPAGPLPSTEVSVNST